MFITTRYRIPVLLYLAIALPAFEASADVGRVKVSSGAVHIERAGQRVAAPVDSVVQASDTIVTGADGSVGVTFIDNTRIAAGPNSALSINRYSFDQTTHAGAFDATVNRGTLAVVSGKLSKQSPDAVTVRTRTMVMGVRGTEFLIDAGE
jgi:hypothetical protein